MNRIPIRIPSQSKYRAKRTDGFASKKEANRAAELELMQQLGQIRGLLMQPSFTLIKADELGPAVKYRADFEYHDCQTDEHVVEDVKGFRTPVYRLKRRLMWTVLGIKVRET